MPKKISATDDQVIKAYRELRSAEKVAAQLGIGQSTAIRILRRCGVDLSGLKEYRASIKGAPKPWSRYDGSDDEILSLYSSGASMREIARKIGRSVHVVARRVRNAGIVRPYQGGGPEHSQWKGERIEASQGYWKVWVTPDDPMAAMRDARGYIKEHRLVLARK
jgi:transposase